MAIQVKASLRKNPQDKVAPGKFYTQVVLGAELTQRQIIEQIADRCTVTGSDVKAVLDSLMTVLKRNLANGNVLRLGDLGSFRLSVSGLGTATAEKCTANTVRKARIIYTPSVELKESVSLFAFSKIGASTTDPEKPEDGGGSEDGGGEAPDPTA